MFGKIVTNNISCIPTIVPLCTYDTVVQHCSIRMATLKFEKEKKKLRKWWISRKKCFLVIGWVSGLVTPSVSSSLCFCRLFWYIKDINDFIKFGKTVIFLIIYFGVFQRNPLCSHLKIRNKKNGGVFVYVWITPHVRTHNLKVNVEVNKWISRFMLWRIPK